MHLGDVVVAARDAEPVRLEQHVGMCVPEGRLEAVRRELDREPERVVEVDRVHEAAILDAAVPDPARVQPLHGLVEHHLRERERDVVHAARLGGDTGRVGSPLLVREDGDQASVARVEVEVTLALVVEVRLLEDERHPEQSFPEVDRRLPVGADEGDVVHALALELLHRAVSLSFVIYELGLVFAALQAPERHELHLGLHREHAAQLRANLLCEGGPGGRIARELHPDGERRLLLHARRPWPDENVAAHRGLEAVHDLTHGRGKDVDTAHDQHVVGATDAAHPRAGAAAAAGARLHRDVVAGAKAQERRCLGAEDA